MPPCISLKKWKLMGKPLGAIKCIWITKSGTLLSFRLGEKLALSRFRLGPSVFLKNRTILLPKYEFHQKRSQRFNTSQPQPHSHMCASMISDQNWVTRFNYHFITPILKLLKYRTWSVQVLYWCSTKPVWNWIHPFLGEKKVRVLETKVARDTLCLSFSCNLIGYF